jgi:hypothetical protein
MNTKTKKRILKVAYSLEKLSSNPLRNSVRSVKPIMKKVRDGDKLSKAERSFLLDFYWTIYKHISEEG